MDKFDARANLFSVVESILTGDKPSQELLNEADRALERINARQLGSVFAPPDEELKTDG